jgi:hypothetical protein
MLSSLRSCASVNDHALSWAGGSSSTSKLLGFLFHSCPTFQGFLCIYRPFAIACCVMSNNNLRRISRRTPIQENSEENTDPKFSVIGGVCRALSFRERVGYIQLVVRNELSLVSFFSLLGFSALSFPVALLGEVGLLTTKFELVWSDEVRADME